MLNAGTRLGPYEILGALGAGGMGEVYRARDPRLARDVAVKVLPPEVAEHPDRLRRFEQEARAAAALSHPNVLVVYDIGTEGRVLYMVTELLEGETLRARLGGGPLPPAKAIDIATQTAAGLAAAHARGITHRDLKPDNIFLTRDGVTKILDFGLAKITAPSAPEQTLSGDALGTLPGAVLGTVGYMAPEQVRGQEAGHTADIFALGAILYEMLCGRRAFEGGSAADVMSSILSRDPVSLASRARGVSSALARVVSRAIEKDPGNRFQSARDFSFALESPEPEKQAQKSIAVLPFRNMSAEPDKEYFSDGLAEELIGALARLPGLQVASRSSTFRFRNSEEDIREIGRQLSVETVLEGSVRRAGNRLRISLQLISVADGYHLWSERYDREMADIFAIQDEITESIVKTLAPALLGKQAPRARRHTENPEAYELWLKGYHSWQQRTETTLRAAMECFQRALQLDPEYALAHAGVCNTIVVLRIYGYISDAEGRMAAGNSAQRAMELAPSLAETHFTMALWSLCFSEDWRVAETHFQRALEIDPKLTVVHAYRGLFLSAAGRSEEAATVALRCAEVDALSPFTNGLSAMTLYASRRYEDALRLSRRALEIDPNFALALWAGGLTHCRQGRPGQAIDLIEKLVSLTRRHSVFVGLLGFAYALGGRMSDVETILAELDERKKNQYVAPMAYLLIHHASKNPEKLREVLLACFEDGQPGFPMAVFAGQYLEEWSTDARLRELLQRLGVIA